MTTFYLVRHGETQYDLAEQRRMRGAMRDFVPLTPKGREQARMAAEQLRKMGVDYIITSPMTRAMETAFVICSELGVPWQVEYDLHEWIPDLSSSYDSAAFALAQSEEMDRLGGEWPPDESRSWEPLSSVRGRVMAALGKHTGEARAAVVTHGTVIHTLTGKKAANGEVMILQLFTPVLQP